MAIDGTKYVRRTVYLPLEVDGIIRQKADDDGVSFTRAHVSLIKDGVGASADTNERSTALRARAGIASMVSQGVPIGEILKALQHVTRGSE